MDIAVSIISIILSILALVVSFCTLMVERRKVIAEYVAANRLDWIKEVRELLYDFAKCYYKHGGQHNDKLRLIKTKIDLYIRKDDPSYKDFDNLLESCFDHEYNEATYNQLIIQSQKVLSDPWKRLKAEAGVTSRKDEKYRKMLS